MCFRSRVGKGWMLIHGSTVIIKGFKNWCLKYQIVVFQSWNYNLLKLIHSQDMLCLRGIQSLNSFPFKYLCWDGMVLFFFLFCFVLFFKKKLLKKESVWWLGYLTLGTGWWPWVTASLHLLLCREVCFGLMLWCSLHWVEPFLSQCFNHLLSFRIALWLVSRKMMAFFVIADVALVNNVFSSSKNF